MFSWEKPIEYYHAESGTTVRTSDAQLVDRLLDMGYRRRDERMTRKDYVKVAEVIRNTASASVSNYGYIKAEIIQIANGLATVFEEDNPRFDADRFLAATGVWNPEGLKR
jgi:hypothetical protein